MTTGPCINANIPIFLMCSFSKERQNINLPVNNTFVGHNSILAPVFPRLC